VGPHAILFDLDDTLLVNPMDTFVPAYFRALTTFMTAELDPRLLIEQLLRATRAMDEDGHPARTNEQAFAEVFYPGLGRDRIELEPIFDRFYRDEFPNLRRLTAPVPGARDVVRWAFEGNRQVVIATNPLFPRTAILQRMEWAGLRLDEMPFDLVTSYDNMHSTKARPDYYVEIAERLGRDPHECVMVGDHWRWDVVHAVSSGMAAWWIAAPGEPVPDPEVPLLGAGSLSDFLEFAKRRWGQGGGAFG
jgi:FMN phosphatase YigB (HAD superfamily)